MNSIGAKTTTAILIALLVISLAANNGAATPLHPVTRTIHVSPSGSDVSNCGSESQPCQSIQFAVNNAVSGDIILVAAGTYTYKSTLDTCTFLVTRAVVCIFEKHLTIIGGFSDGDWTVSDPTTNVTTIHGQNTWRGVAVIRSIGVASLTMEGFTIQNGRATGNPVGNNYQGHAFGGGLWASFSAVHLKNMIFKDNIAQGGSNSRIADAGWAFGGGLAIEGPSTSGGSTIDHLTFINNQARGGSGSNGGGNGLGGGAWANLVALNATNLTLTNNLAKGGDTNGNGCNARGGGYGGAIAAGDHTDIHFSNIIATENTVIGANALGPLGCAGYGIGAGFFMEAATIEITDSVLQSNHAYGGNAKTGGVAWAGGFYAERANISLNRVKIIANTVQSGNSTYGGQAGPAGGGGAYFAAFDSQNYYSTITNCLFADNRAIMGDGINGTGGGGGLYIQAVDVDITHSTFANNKLENGISNGQAILVIALLGTSGKSGHANVKYSVITDHLNNYPNNNSALEVFSGNSATLSYIWFGNNTSHISVPPGTPQDHIWKENSSADYVSPSYPNYDYHLQAISPVIDLAEGSTLSVDLDGLSRPYNYVADLGAYEYRTTYPVLTAESPINVLTDSNTIITRTSLISITFGPPVQWTATTSSNWLYLGPTGNSQQTSGQTGFDLVIRIDPSMVGIGTHQTTIQLTSPTADPTSITVSLSKVDQIENFYLPIILH